MVELETTVGSDPAPEEKSISSMIRRFCMSGVSRQSDTCPISAQVTDDRPRKGPSFAVSNR